MNTVNATTIENKLLDVNVLVFWIDVFGELRAGQKFLACFLACLNIFFELRRIRDYSP